ncbi:K+-transporting ATPase [Paramagnetospirillum caucaseum]|uniref:Potassium-transporting ATPase KdpC subunit n=1 Tax=Paramagnetospirillum caucaseum TaxID=1244869 RepID=M2Z547_9PROT|nr:potassium-transporting ATPase subunit KdpC [Paramagnetospirillum caucaseum]EME69450.1 K+-transporting ATPase [Paramagnetospirillum caucaseum]
MVKELRPALTLLVLLTLIAGLAYPFAVTGLAGIAFPWQANGSLIEKDGHVIGSALIGQTFTGRGYFWGRPSATAVAPYDAANSGGSNLAPSAKALAEAVAERDAALRAAHPEESGPVPADLLTTSASGLDPHITPAAAMWQIKRVAMARHIPMDQVRTLVMDHVEGRELGVLGEPRVNVLRLNLVLDERWPMR